MALGTAELPLDRRRLVDGAGTCRMIVNSPQRAYLNRMTVMRLLRFLTIFAVLLAPLTMTGGHAAMSMPAAASTMDQHSGHAMTAEHCAGMSGQSDDQPHRKSGPSIDCMIACSCLPATGSEMGKHALRAAIVEPPALAAGLAGLNPESDTPPPRLA